LVMNTVRKVRSVNATQSDTCYVQINKSNQGLCRTWETWSELDSDFNSDSPSERNSLYSWTEPGNGSVRVRITLRLAVYRQSVRLGNKPLETCDQLSFSELNTCGHSL
jgi:hypothetical protein